jgi:hypothetical protein
MKEVIKYFSKNFDEMKFYGYFGLLVVITVFFTLFWGNL